MMSSHAFLFAHHSQWAQLAKCKHKAISWHANNLFLLDWLLLCAKYMCRCHGTYLITGIIQSEEIIFIGLVMLFVSLLVQTDTIQLTQKSVLVLIW